MGFSLPGEWVILGIVIIGILSLFMVGIEYSIPTFDRAMFDDICNKYLAIIEKNGGLSSSDITNLENELTSLGFTNINVIAPTSVSWGNEATLRVTADYEFQITKLDGSKKIMTKTATYENSTIVLTLTN
ncbi:MAG: hypothetical protein PWQ37_2898 [Candidatus Petromonas sp.]|jgi:hypothetical protein|nr:hypothetical protein [Candidatus Petromonas sp.]